jgi:hypothetical protein
MTKTAWAVADQQMTRVDEMPRGFTGQMTVRRFALEVLPRAGELLNKERVTHIEIDDTGWIRYRVETDDGEWPQPPISVLDWAVQRWNEQVQNRPLRNVHRRTLDDVWRQVIRAFGGDPDKLVGPSHDTLKAMAEGSEPHDPSILVTRSLLQAAINEIRAWKVEKGGDDQVFLNLQAALDAHENLA